VSDASDDGTVISRRVKDASPVGRDLVARLARAGIETQLFGAPLRAIKVGRYEVLAELGTGGMGVVYRARDPELDREVAIKLLRPTGTRHDPDTSRARLMREARAMARLSHPNVLTVHEVGTFEDQVFVAMEYVEGQTLADWLGETERAWDEIVQRFCAAGLGLIAAHEKGIVHRDFKPENVMVSDDARVLVLDFGLARSSEDGAEPAEVVDLEGIDPSLTLTGALVGTPAYMAPELYAGRSADARSDQFAFCVALWEAVYRQRPFTGNSLPALAQSVMDGELREPIGVAPRPAWLRRALERGLSVDPDDRFATMVELVATLRAGLQPRWTQRWLPAVVGGVAFVIGLGLMIAARQDPESLLDNAAADLDPRTLPEPPLPRTSVVVAPAGGPPVSAAPPPEVAASSSTTGGEASDTSTGGATRRTRGPKFSHAWCYYSEDGFRRVRAPSDKLLASVSGRGTCWSCRRGDASTLRGRVDDSDCREYAVCHDVACE
jgi:tRNA A-37 threonylcarbamoyl transferase component Bud32